MKRHLSRAAAAFALVALLCAGAAAQGVPAGALTGTVTDPQGAVIGGASVVVRSNATGQEFTTQTADNGTFNVPALASGNYTATITAQGFKQAVVQNIKVDVGTPSSIAVALEVGAVSDTITITAAGGELLQTQSQTVGTTITGRQIVEQPQASRDALDLVTLLPGVQTTGRPRTSHVNGLPYGALNITIDGANVQDNLIKSGDGFFTYVRPRIDAIDEVTVSTATPGAESSGTGAVQIKFITRSGTNDLRGSLYWYHREPTLSANYYFRNRDLQPRPGETKVRPDRVLLNQFGGRVGGPIRIPHLFDGRDKAFFFVNYEEFHLPETQLRTRTVFNTNVFGGTTPGNFTYTSGGVTRTVNLLTLAAANGQTSTLDPTVQNALSTIRGFLGTGTLSASPFSPNLQNFNFTQPGGQDRYFPTVRFDYNITKNHHLENIWNYQRFTGKPVDFLNFTDPSFIGATNFGGQDSHRFSNSTAVRSTLTSNLVNEARFSLTGGNSQFLANVSPASFANQGGFHLAFSDSCCGTIAPATPGQQSNLLTDLTANTFPGSFLNGNFGNSSNRRNTPTKEFADTLTWIRGAHTFNFGGVFTQINSYQFNLFEIVPSVYFGLVESDPANGLFEPGNPLATAAFPGASDAQLAEAGQIYALLTGRVTAIGKTAFNDEGRFQTEGPQTTRFRQREFGIFAQDSWRFRPNLTLNYGLRYEPQQAPVPLNNTFTRTTKQGLFGVSGNRGLFNPGVSPGATPTQFVQYKQGDKIYQTDWNNFAPSVGFAYSPDWKSGIMHRLLGDAGQSVLRAGYSLAYVREGLSAVITPTQGNPGGLVDQSLFAEVNLPGGSLLRNRASFPDVPVPPMATFPVTVSETADILSGFDEHFKTGYVQSWTLGVQRELTKDMVLEARYVGTRGIDLLRRYSLNEVNALENGFTQEFRRAQANLLANRAAGRGNNFRYFGNGTGTVPLPLLLQFFTGQSNAARNPNDPANYGSGSFASGTFVGQLNPALNNVIGFATSLATTGAFLNNGIAAGLPANFFQVNPDARFGNVTLTDNGTHTYYDAFQLELRRRMSRGLLLQASYTYSKSQSNVFATSTGNQQTGFANYVSLHNVALTKSTSPYDVPHSFKVNWIYELPMGRGQLIAGNANGLVDRVLGGWEVHGTVRVQSGRPFRLGNVQLVGMSAKDLQHAVEIRKDPNRIVFFFPEDIILNTRRAFNTSATSDTGYSALGVPTGRFIAPPGYGGCIQSYAGQCGFSQLVLHGPRFVRVDMSVVKKIKFTERTNLELRGEFLNAINNINFFVGGAASSDVAAVTNFNSAAFGTTNAAYQDTSTTNDPGGRLVQFVIRFNF
ncbi:MAG TPA: TonB-dependent receptor [Pyrinomonadaceae bacterium]|jgi:hypothetical protein